VRETQHELIKYTKESGDSFGLMRADNQSPLIKFNLHQTGAPMKTPKRKTVSAQPSN